MTGATVRARAAAAFQLANLSPSAFAARCAIDFADQLCERRPEPWRAYLRRRWGKHVERVWHPAANTTPVSTYVKLLQKGTEALPKSIRYIHKQMELAAAPEAAQKDTTDLLNDIVRCFCLGTHGDPRPVDITAREALLRAAPAALFARIRGSRAPELYLVINRFVLGLTAVCPSMRYALTHPGAPGITCPLITHSYTAIIRRIEAAPPRAQASNHGVSRAHLSKAGAAALAEVTRGGTSKRVKASVLALGAADRAALSAAVCGSAEQPISPLSAEEAAAQETLPDVYVLWCGECRTWRSPQAMSAHTGSQHSLAPRGPYVRIDLNRPGVGLCSVCPDSVLAPARLNGRRVGQLRLCSKCGDACAGRPAPPGLHGVLVVCGKCAALPPEPRPCALCAGPSTGMVISRGPTRLHAVWFCAAHNPGPTAFDPVHTTAEELLATLRRRFGIPDV